ncbi:hypothetical protein KKG71_04430 [Patescibacteria group bacterium]|nr:hypothetical protein [Patescibacteria group bacterium]
MQKGTKILLGLVVVVVIVAATLSQTNLLKGTLEVGYQNDEMESLNRDFDERMVNLDEEFMNRENQFMEEIERIENPDEREDKTREFDEYRRSIDEQRENLNMERDFRINEMGNQGEPETFVDAYKIDNSAPSLERASSNGINCDFYLGANDKVHTSYYNANGSGGAAYYIDSGGYVDAAGGGSNMVYMKNGSTFDAAGGGSNTVYYETGAFIIDTTATLINCPVINFY